MNVSIGSYAILYCDNKNKDYIITLDGKYTFKNGIENIISLIISMAPSYDFDNPDQLDEWDEIVSLVEEDRILGYKRKYYLPNGYTIELNKVD